MLDYFTHKFDPNNFTLVMTILVKNEADIIESNIRTHSKLGVDAFVIMDNGSTDGTREILSQLQKEFDMIIIDETGKYIQKKFMTRLAFEAKKHYKPDWIINNDADEFWIPNDKESLKKHLAFKGGILQVQRSNMILPPEALNDSTVWKASQYQVVNQIHYREVIDDKLSVLFGKASRKVIVNPYGLIKINTGNHSAEHIAFWKKHESKSLHIYHYPVRGYEQFFQRVETRMNVINNDPSVKLGNHEKRWATLLKNNNLDKEYKDFFMLNQCEIEFMLRIGMIIKNSIPSEIIM